MEFVFILFHESNKSTYSRICFGKRIRQNVSLLGNITESDSKHHKKDFERYVWKRLKEKYISSKFAFKCLLCFDLIFLINVYNLNDWEQHKTGYVIYILNK